MSDTKKHGRQPGWRIVVAATAVTLTGGAAAVSAADGSTAARVTLDDLVPMRELSAPAPVVVSSGTVQVTGLDRYDSPFDIARNRIVVAAPAATDVAALDPTGDGTTDLTPDNTPNSPDPTPDPTPNSPDPTPNSPDPTPDPTPDSPDPTPDSPDPTPDSPDASPDASQD